MTRLTVSSVLVLACLSVSSPAAQVRGRGQAPVAPPADPQTPPVFRGAVRVVPVDVRVVDAKGAPVSGLTAADFAVFENGIRQPITQFLSHTLQSNASLAAAPRALRSENRATAATMAADRRVVLIVLGRGRLQEPQRGVDGLMHFVRERLLPQDVVAVMAYDRATDFTIDHEEIAGVLDRFKKNHEKIDALLKNTFTGLRVVNGSRDLPESIRKQVDVIFAGVRSGAGKALPPVPIMDAERIGRDIGDSVDPMRGLTGALVRPMDDSLDEFLGVHAQSMQDLGNLYTGIEYLRYIDGEKHLIFMTESGVMLPRGDDDRNLARNAADARVAIDYFQVGGTPMGRGLTSGFAAEARTAPFRAGAPPAPTANFVSASVIQTGRELATTTGGRMYVSQFPNSSKALDDLDGATRSGYTLGYSPSNLRLDNRYRNIVVRIPSRPDLRVEFRRGYYARAEPAFFDLGVMRTYSRVTSAVSYGANVRDLGVSVSAEPQYSNRVGPIRVLVKIDLARVKFAKDAGRNTASLEVATFAADSKGTVVGYAWQTLELTFTDERLSAVQHDGISHEVVIDAAAQARDVKVVVYDAAADLTGSMTFRLK